MAIKLQNVCIGGHQRWMWVVGLNDLQVWSSQLMVDQMLTCLQDYNIELFVQQEAIALCCDAIEKAGYTGKIEIGMDIAATELFKDGQYDLDFKKSNSNLDQWLTPDQITISVK